MLGIVKDPAITAVTLLAMVAITAFFLIISGEQRTKFRQSRDLAATATTVFMMCAVTSVFFVIADQFMRLVVTLLLDVGG